MLTFLAQQGLPLERMRLSQAGPWEPYPNAPDRELHTRDSRVEIFLLDEVAPESIGLREERQPFYEASDKETEHSGNQ